MASLSVATDSWTCAMQELDVDGALLMQMLDDNCIAVDDEADDDQLGGVIRSLEAEIGLAGDELMIDAGDELMIEDGESTTGPSDGGLVVDVLSDECLMRSVVGGIEDPFDWVEMDVVSDSSFRDLSSWYFAETTPGGVVDTDAICYGNGREFYSNSHHGEGLAYADQVFDPLWQ